VRLIVVRHGATANNASGRATGQTDVAMSSLGLVQAEALAGRLATATLDHMVSSDLIRARETANRIAVHHPTVPLSLDADLREITMGEWEGMTQAEVLARDPAQAARWLTDPATVAPPGGETYGDLRDRLLRALDRWTTAVYGGTVLWVTHGGAIGVLLCHALGLDLSRRFQFRRDNASITELRIENGAMILVRHNDTAHLEYLAHTEGTEPSQVL
jgi:broad specificity phosphatase PhoE